MTAPIWIDFLGRPQPIQPRHQRIVQSRWDLAPGELASPLSSTARVSSSTNSGTPPVRSTTVAMVSSDSALCAATSPPSCARCGRSAG